MRRDDRGYRAVMLRLLITLPFLIALIVFAIYNQQVVSLSLPGYSRQSTLGLLVIVIALVFFLVGAIAVWFAELRQRRRARRAEQAARALEAQLADVRSQLAQAHAQAQVRGDGVATPSGGVSPYALPAPQPPSVV